MHFLKICNIIILIEFEFIIAIRKFPYESPFYILFGILSGIFTIITLIIFHFTAVKDGLTTFILMSTFMSFISPRMNIS